MTKSEPSNLTLRQQGWLTLYAIFVSIAAFSYWEQSTDLNREVKQLTREIERLESTQSSPKEISAPAETSIETQRYLDEFFNKKY